MPASSSAESASLDGACTNLLDRYQVWRATPRTERVRGANFKRTLFTCEIALMPAAQEEFSKKERARNHLWLTLHDTRLE